MLAGGGGGEIVNQVAGHIVRTKSKPSMLKSEIAGVKIAGPEMYR